MCIILSERSEGGQPLGQRIMRPRKSNSLTLTNDKTCSWRGQFELGNTCYTNELSITDVAQERILLKVWDAASASLVLIHSYPRPHVLVTSIHGYVGVSRGPQTL